MSSSSLVSSLVDNLGGELSSNSTFAYNMHDATDVDGISGSAVVLWITLVILFGAVNVAIVMLILRRATAIRKAKGVLTKKQVLPSQLDDDLEVVIFERKPSYTFVTRDQQQLVR